MKLALFRGFGLAFCIWGLILLAVPAVSITGFAIVEDVGTATRSILGIVFIAGGIFLLLIKPRLEEIVEGERVKRIGNTFYSAHALERMGERNLFPTIVENAIDQGRHYKLSHVMYEEGMTGATDAYIEENSADVIRTGKVGERLIPAGNKRGYKHVIVLTGKGGVVKTAYIGDDRQLKDFLRKYSSQERKAA